MRCNCSRKLQRAFRVGHQQAFGDFKLQRAGLEM